MINERSQDSSGQTGPTVDFEDVSEELYRLALHDFTAVRDVRESEARKSGDTKLADSLKRLHKPTVGAWLANLLAHDRTEDLEHLIRLGAELRREKHADGELIRRVSKEKQDAIAELLREAKTMAAHLRQPVSGAAATDLEATLDAAFADSKAAESVHAGRLTTALHYSGLGFADMGTDTSACKSSAKRTGAESAAASRELELANRDALRADANLDKARDAVAAAEDDLKRLKAEAALAVRRAKDAHKRASAANKKVGK
jgi:hypothetical protein